MTVAKINTETPQTTFNEEDIKFYGSLKQEAATLTQNAGSIVQGINTAQETALDRQRQQHQQKIETLLKEDLISSIKLEDTPTYKVALLPRLASQTTPPVTNADSCSAEVLNLLQKNFQLTLQTLQSQQAIALRDFTNQLKDYAQRIKAAEPKVGVDDFVQKQTVAFQSHQQMQLNNLQSLYEQRQQNFLNRLARAPHDFELLKTQGLKGKALTDALTFPSRYGNSATPELTALAEKSFRYYVVDMEVLFANPFDASIAEREQLTDSYQKSIDKNSSALTRAFYQFKLRGQIDAYIDKHGHHPFEFIPQPQEKLKYSVTISAAKNGQPEARVVFDVPSGSHIGYSDRLRAWSNALTQLKGKAQFNLTWAKLSFPEASETQLATARKEAANINAVRNPCAFQNPAVTAAKDALGNLIIDKDGHLVPASACYEAVLAMARQILSQNPNAKINPGYLPTAPVDYQTKFKEVMANAGTFYNNARQQLGLAANDNSPAPQQFNVPTLAAAGPVLAEDSARKPSKIRFMNPVASASAAASSTPVINPVSTGPTPGKSH